MLQKNKHTGIFLALLLLSIIGIRQVYAAIPTPDSSPGKEETKFFFCSDTPDFIPAGEQREGFTSLKSVAKPSFKSRLFSWLADPIAYRNGLVSSVNYFSDSKNRIPSLEPPDIIFPFHSFW